MAQTATDLVDRVIPRVPVRQWVLSFPIPLRILFAAHPELLSVPRIVHRVITRLLLERVFDIDVENCPDCGGGLDLARLGGR